MCILIFVLHGPCHDSKFKYLLVQVQHQLLIMSVLVDNRCSYIIYMQVQTANNNHRAARFCLSNKNLKF